MTAKRRGRPPKSDEGKANAEKARTACAKAIAALNRNYERAAARILLCAAKEVVVDPHAKLRGMPGYADLAKCAVTVLRAFHWNNRPPSQALADLMALLLADGGTAPYGAPSPSSAQRRALIKYLAEAPDPSKVTPAEAAGAMGVSWKTAKKWLNRQDVWQEAAALRARLSNPSWAVDAHKAAARRRAADNRDARRGAPLVAVARDALKPKPTDDE